MFVYNVSVSVNREVEKDWLDWMETVHIPEVIDTGYFNGYSMFRVLLNHDENTCTYSVQYTFTTMKDLQMYQSREAPALQQKHLDRYGDKCTAFRSVLEKVL